MRIDAAIALRWASVISSMFMVSNGMMFGWVGVVADLEGVDEIGREKDRHDGNGDDEQHSSKTHTNRKDQGRFIPVQIEYVGCEIRCATHALPNEKSSVSKNNVGRLAVFRSFEWWRSFWRFGKFLRLTSWCWLGHAHQQQSLGACGVEMNRER